MYAKFDAFLQFCTPQTIRSSAIDAVPIFCGNVSHIEYQDDLPYLKENSSLIDVHSTTACLVGGDVHITEVERLWVKNVQRKHYSDAFVFLEHLDGAPLRSVDGKTVMRKLKLAPPSICLSHHLFLDDHHLIRVKTSLDKAVNLSYDQRNPWLLPVSDPYRAARDKVPTETSLLGP